jgi:transposase InsO family protein
MYMPYTNNPKLPEVRMKAVLLVRKGWSVRKTARYFGFSHASVLNWMKKAPRDGRRTIPTESSRPKKSPRAIPDHLVARIIATRKQSKRCSEVVYEMLKADGVSVSLSTVKRTLSRFGCLNRRSPWKKKRSYPMRPNIKQQGDLVQIDTIHFMDKEGKLAYVYTALDVYSRYGFALISPKANGQRSVWFLKHMLRYFPFSVKCIQTDNGPEFGLHFTDAVTRGGMTHRHIHPRSPNENGHLERFNRTLQEEIPKHDLCIFIPKDISKFLDHYNTKRMHMGIKFKTPQEKMQEVVRSY